jgi:hypothetical protein
MRTAPRWLALVLLSTAVAGCSGGPRVVPVSGKLTMYGKAIKNIKVDFHPDPDKGTTGPGSSGTTDAEGNFTLKCSATGNPAGAIVGHHRVILTDLDTFGNVWVGRAEYQAIDEKGGKMEVPKKSRIPALYQDLARTPLKQEVKEGMGVVTFDIK